MTLHAAPADFLTARSVAHTTISGGEGLRRGIVDMTGAWSRAG